MVSENLTNAEALLEEIFLSSQFLLPPNRMNSKVPIFRFIIRERRKLRNVVSIGGLKILWQIPSWEKVRLVTFPPHYFGNYFLKNYYLVPFDLRDVSKYYPVQLRDSVCLQEVALSYHFAIFLTPIVYDENFVVFCKLFYDWKITSANHFILSLSNFFIQIGS